MYKNIIFDLGGVIVDWKPHDFLMERFIDADAEKKIYNLTFGSEEWQMLDSGELTRSEANKRMLENAKAADCQFEVEEVLATWTSILRPRKRVIELANFLKRSGYKIYCLSNIAEDTFELLCRAEILPEFDGGVTSFEIGCNKPDEEIYKYLLKKYKLKAKECIFIDDTPANVKAASALDMTGIRMGKSVNALIRNLRACTITFK